MVGHAFAMQGPMGTQLQMIDGWLSIQRVGDRFVGGVYAELSANGLAPAQYTVAAPFDVAVPMP